MSHRFPRLRFFQHNPSGPHAVQPVVDHALVTAFQITSKTVTVTGLAGQVFQFLATAYNSAGTAIPGVAVTWSVGDTGVASISGTGLVTMLRSGSTTVTATVDGRAYPSVVTVSLTTGTITPLTVATYVNAMQTAGHDIRAIFLASDLGASPDTGTHWVANWVKPGTSFPDLVLSGASGHFSKTTRNGFAVLRITGGGYVKLASTSSVLDFSADHAVYAVASANSQASCIMSVQDTQDFTGPSRKMALITDNNGQNRYHPNIDFLSPSDRYHLRCALDNNLRTWGMGFKAKVGTEPGARYNLQRSADCAVENTTDIVHGRNADGSNASAISPTSGANFLQLAMSAGTTNVTQDDWGAIIVVATAQNGDSAILTQQFGVDVCGAYQETGKRVVWIGDSVGLQISSGRPDLSSADLATYATADGASTAAEALLPAGFILTCACWQGESAWSAYNRRRDFIYPIFLNARSRSELVVIVNLPVNDLPWSAEYQDNAGSLHINATVQALLQWIRTLTGTIRIVQCDMGPAWVDGLNNPTDPRETTRVAVNTAFATQSPANYDLLRKVSTDPTIGQPGQNTNATNYIQVDGLLVHYQMTNNAGPALTIRRSMMATDVAAVA